MRTIQYVTKQIQKTERSIIKTEDEIIRIEEILQGECDQAFYNKLLNYNHDKLITRKIRLVDLIEELEELQENNK